MNRLSASRDQCQEENPNQGYYYSGVRYFQALLADMTGSLAAYTSFEVPFGDPQYRRWIHISSFVTAHTIIDSREHLCV